MWDEVIRENGGPLLPKTPQTGHEVTRWNAAGLAALYRERTDLLDQALAALKALPKGNEEVRKALKPGEEAKAKPKADAKKPAGPNDQEKAILRLEAFKLVLSGSKKAADAVDKAAPHLTKEALAACWLKLGNQAKATEAAAKIHQDLAGATRQAELYLALEKLDDAKKSFEKVRDRAYAMDADLPMRKRMDALAQKLGIKGDWKKPAPKRDDVGKRPDLVSLGPVHWAPPQAPKWEGLTPEGKPMSDKDFSGKPVVLVFYIGSTCGHCMEQLNAMEGAISEFKKRGFPVVALSPEPVALVGKAAAFSKNKQGFPFPIIAAKDRGIFRAFRAWDDFEDVPLHAVAVVDGQGRLRWLDVSYEPFMELKFVAEEAERLLKQG
jgi:peroxiredoxin